MRGKRSQIVPRIAAVAISCLLALQMPTYRSSIAYAKPLSTGAPGVRIGVLGLFHPHDFTVTAVNGSALLVQAGDRQEIVEASSGIPSAVLRLSNGNMILNIGSTWLRILCLRVTGRDGKSADFDLAVPGRISRRYRGTLDIEPAGNELIAIVTMDLETSVASVVAAETLPGIPLEALKAQAIVTRSYLVSGRGRHINFDFCDTTHCQFLREPPKAGSLVAQAVQATHRLVLSYDSHPFPAMFTRSCSGHTRTAAELGLRSDSYPYYDADCAYCRSHPARWVTRISDSDARLLRSSDESSRLRLTRRLGWSTVPSNDFNSTHSGSHVILHGTGYGHGIGLCQAGSAAMARDGDSFEKILSHYYPNTNVIRWTGKE